MSTLTRLAKDRLDPIISAQRPHNVRTGLIALAIATVLATAGLTGRLPLIQGPGGRVVRAVVTSADGLNNRTPVKVGGVQVGHVNHLEPGPGGHDTTVVMRITTSGIELRRDATAQIRWRTLLGGDMYVDLSPGSPSAPQLGNDTIPLADTGIQVDWDTLTSQFGARTRHAAQQMTSELRTTFGSPAAEATTLSELGPSLRRLGHGVEPLRGEQPGELTRAIETTAGTLRALASTQASLQQLITGADSTLAATSAHATALAQAVALSPPALSSTTSTMRQLDTTLGHLDPLVAKMRPGARALAPTLVRLQPALITADRVLHDALPLLHAAPPGLDELANTSPTGVSLLNALQPTITRTQDELIPFLDRRDSDTQLRNYEAIGPFFSAVSGGAEQFDADGHLTQFPALAGPDSLLLPCDIGLQPLQGQRCDLVNQLLDDVLGGGHG